MLSGYTGRIEQKEKDIHTAQNSSMSQHLKVKQMSRKYFKESRINHAQSPIRLYIAFRFLIGVY
jgi:hypothetical protein